MNEKLTKPSDDTGGGLVKGDYTAIFKISQLDGEVFATLDFDPLVTTPEIANTPAYILMSDVIEYYLWRVGIVDDDGKLIHPEALGNMADFDLSKILGNSKLN